MNDPKEFANRVSGLILDQIDNDRAVNKENIAFVVEREVRDYAPPIDKNAVVNAAIDLQAALVNMSGVNWSSWVIDAYTALSSAIREDNGRLG